MKKLLIGAAVLVGASLTHSMNAQAASTNGTANAKVIAGLTITAGANLNFGTIAPSAVAGTVVISPAGARSATLGAGLVTDGANAPTAGVFTVTGATGYPVSITLPVTATITSGANNMTVGTFLATPVNPVPIVAGAATINVGATLNVGANQVAGSYTGTYPVSVNYN